MKTKATCIQLTPGLVVDNSGDKKCNSILVACQRLFPRPRNQSHVDHTPKHLEQFFANLLAQGAAKEVYKKLLEMLRGVVHVALVVRPWEQPVAGHQD